MAFSHTSFQPARAPHRPIELASLWFHDRVKAALVPLNDVASMETLVKLARTDEVFHVYRDSYSGEANSSILVM
jgi:hypothetical protein